MSIQENITREEVSYRGGGVELDLSNYGYEDEYISAYQNYLGGGMRGSVANSCTIDDWEMDERLVRLAEQLRDYFLDRMRELDYIDEFNESVEGLPVRYSGL